MTAKPNPPVSPVEAKVGKTRARKPLAELSKNTLRTVPPIKWSQRCAYKTDEWRHHYGMRSLVEYSNSLLKSAMQGGVDKKENDPAAATQRSTSLSPSQWWHPTSAGFSPLSRRGNEGERRVQAESRAATQGRPRETTPEASTCGLWMAGPCCADIAATTTSCGAHSTDLSLQCKQSRPVNRRRAAIARGPSLLLWFFTLSG